MESAGWISRPNPAAVGIVGNPNVAASTAFASYGLTKMFGDYIQGLEGNVGFGIVPTTTTTGNHVYDGLRNTMSTTGCLPAAAGQQFGSLMALNFASVGTADGATACFGAGGTQLITYSTVNDAVGSMLNALGPLQNLPNSAQNLLQTLNNRVTTDQRFRLGLEQLAGQLQAAQSPLALAQTEADVATKVPTTVDQTDQAAVAAINPLISQIDCAAALMKLGLLHATTVAIANSDPNAGGNHAARGGTNTAFGPRSPNEVKSCVGQAISHIYSLFPNAIVSITCDGGRTADGGDAENFEAFIFGPSNKIASVFVNADGRSDSGMFGNTPPAATLSNGSSAPPTEANVMATVAQAAGFTLPNIPYIPALLVG